MKDKALLSDIMFLLVKIAIFVAVVFVMFTYLFGIYRVVGDEMSPSFRDGDLAVYYRMQEDYRSSDTVVVEVDDTLSVRRIVAMPGDTVDITEDGLMINGYFQQESNIYTQTLPYKEGITFPITLGKDEYFVLGDDRTKAADSRMYGAVNKSAIKGNVFAMIRRRGF